MLPEGGPLDHAPSTNQIDSIRVNLGERSYDILVGNGWFDEFGSLLKRKHPEFENVMVFTSPTIGGLYYARLEQSLSAAGYRKVRRYDIPDGEENKSLRQFADCCEAIVKFFPRSESTPVVLNLGGGVVGDMGGFVASTFLRSGVPYIQIPTTLLGCVDCGVGGKVGVNSHAVKNIIGRFYQPQLVFADLSLLQTLPLREIRSGVAEVIKYGVVCDAPLFEFLEKHIEDLLSLREPVLSHVVSECYRIKARVVESDEEEHRGLRNVLNYGHTVGHALEMAAHFEMTHGEAISVGMIAANRIALKLGVCGQALCERVSDLLQRAGLPIRAGNNISLESLVETMMHDKKFREGRNLFVLPTTIGNWKPQRDIPMPILREAIGSCLEA